MKIKFIIYFFFVVLITNNFNATAQNVEDMAVVKIDSVLYPNDKTIVFTLSLTKISPAWNYFANSTIQLGFDDPNYQITPSNTNFRILDESSCEINNVEIMPTSGGQNLRDNSYIMTWEILNGRISITIGGPKEFNYCETFALDERKALGKFEITTSENTIPKKLIFLEGEDNEHPYYFYQALAYKTNTDLERNGVPNWYSINDNIEMNNGIDTQVLYIIDDRQPDMIEDSLQAIYAGNKRVELRWLTRSEPFHKGFIIERLWKPFEATGIDGLPFDTPVGSWDTGLQKDEILVFNPANRFGKNPYIYQFDEVPQREERYYYRLLYQDIQDSIIALDTCFIDIPAVLIYDITASDNPFGDNTDNKTNIIFHLEEDAYVTCKIYDLEGKLVETLIDNELRLIGKNTVEFAAKPFSQQGLYTVIVEAYPTVEMKIDKGQASYKLQYLR